MKQSSFSANFRIEVLSIWTMLKDNLHNFYYQDFSSRNIRFRQTVNVLPGNLPRVIQKQTPDVFYKKVVLRNFTKFTGKHLCQSLFFNTLKFLLLQNTSGGCFC